MQRCESIVKRYPRKSIWHQVAETLPAESFLGGVRMQIKERRSGWVRQWHMHTRRASKFRFGIDPPPRPDEDITRSSQYSAQCLLWSPQPSTPCLRHRHLQLLQLPPVALRIFSLCMCEQSDYDMKKVIGKRGVLAVWWRIDILRKSGLNSDENGVSLRFRSQSGNHIYKDQGIVGLMEVNVYS